VVPLIYTIKTTRLHTSELASQAHQQQQEQKQSPSLALNAGIPAPNFSLLSTPDQSVSLYDFRGHPTIIAFYPADFSPVCGDQMTLYNEVLPEFQHYDAQLLGISVDGVWCHLAFSKDRKLRFPLLSDFEPKGEVAREYGVYRKRDGVT
jgi:peroxiredoxin